MNTCVEVTVKVDPEKALLKKLMTVRYRRYGRDLSGLDCWGAVILWYQTILNIQVLDVIGEYPKSPVFDHCFIENYHRNWVKVTTPMKHDVIMFVIGEKIHAGFCIGKNMFFHMSPAGASRGNLDYPVWQNKVKGYYRHRSLINQYENHR